MNHNRKRYRDAGSANDEAHADPTAVKRSKSYSDADVHIAKILDRLGSLLENDRIAAGIEIVDAFSSLSASRQKILRRLVRGLCSSRNASRLGFFTALTELLRLAVDEPQIFEKSEQSEALDHIFRLVNSETEPKAAPTNQVRNEICLQSAILAKYSSRCVTIKEKRDYSLGRLSAYNALIHSGVLFDENDSLKCLENVLGNVWEIRRRDSQLEEQCGRLYYDLVRIAGQQKSLIKPIEETLHFLASKAALKTQEGIAIWIEAANSGLDIQFPKDIWHNNPLSKREISVLTKILNSSSNAAASNAQLTSSAGRRRDKPHFVWSVIIDKLCGLEADRAADDKSLAFSAYFKKLWTGCVELSYFATTASPERKAVGFRLYSMVLENAQTWACEIASSSNLINCLINQERNAERYLHQAAKSVLDSLKVRIAYDAKLVPLIASILIYKQGFPNADHIKRARNIMCDIFESLPVDAASAVIHIHMDAVNSLLMRNRMKHLDISKLKLLVKTLCDTMLTFNRKRKLEKGGNATMLCPWNLELLVGMAKVSCLEWNLGVEGSQGPEASQLLELRQDLVSKLWSCLKETFSIVSIDKADALCNICREMSNEKRENLYALASDDQAWAVCRHAHSLLVSMENDEKNIETGSAELHVIQAFRLMIAVALLLIYCGEKDSLAMIDELEKHYENFRQGRESSDRTLDDVVDILLAFISKPEAVYRNLVEQVFMVFCSHITFSGLEPLIRVLDQDENINGQKELFDPEAEEGDGRAPDTLNTLETATDDLNKQTNGREASDWITQKEASWHSDLDSQPSDDKDDDDENDEGMDDDADEALDQSLAEILQTRSFGSGMNGSVEQTGDSSSDEPMDDEQMEALGIDEKLAEIFSQHRSGLHAAGNSSSKKREQKDAKRNMLNFKNRVLDLLSIYVRQQHSSAHTLGLIVPLIQLTGETGSPQISKRTADLMDTYFKAAKSKGMPLTAPSADLWNALRGIHNGALQFRSKVHASISSKSSLFLARLLLLKQESGAMDRLIQLYAETHSRRMKDKSGLPASFWTDFVNWTVSMSEKD